MTTFYFESCGGDVLATASFPTFDWPASEAEQKKLPRLAGVPVEYDGSSAHCRLRHDQVTEAIADLHAAGFNVDLYDLEPAPAPGSGRMAKLQELAAVALRLAAGEDLAGVAVPAEILRTITAWVEEA
jgi:hypothetical protein